MLRIYFYPKFNPKFDPSSNPYTYNFERALIKHHTIINNSVNKFGVLEFYKYLFKSDIYLFNWIENITAFRNASSKVLFYWLFLLGAKMLKKKIIWIYHNKYLHYKKGNLLTNIMFYLLMKHSNLIITHSQSGIDAAQKKYPEFSSKISYLMHPVQEIIPRLDLPKKYDILIWGVILPYKGIVEFLKFLKESNDYNLYKILIVGKCVDNDYKTILNQYLSENIIHFDSFFEIREIARFANQSKYVLFTYKSESFLSSGALMDSIRMGSNIIGPNIGAFKDINCYSFIRTYETYDDIIKILRNAGNLMKSNSKEIQEFCRENRWDNFIEKFNIELSSLINS